MFYERFVQLCKMRGVSTSKAAIDAGLSKSTVTKWKKDPSTKPSGNVIEKLCRYFGITVSELLGDTEDENPEDIRHPVPPRILNLPFSAAAAKSPMPCMMRF